MTTITQPFVAKIEFIVANVAKKGMYKATALAVLYLIEILIAIGFILLIEVMKIEEEKVFPPYVELREVWLSNSIPCFGFAVYKYKKDAAFAAKACNEVEVCGCRIRVTYARPKRMGQDHLYHSNNMRCYQCGYNSLFYRDCPEITAGEGHRRKNHYRRDKSTRGDHG